MLPEKQSIDLTAEVYYITKQRSIHPHQHLVYIKHIFLAQYIKAIPNH